MARSAGGKGPAKTGTPYQRHFKAAALARAETRRAKAKRFSESNRLPYAEAVKTAGAVLFGADWIGPISEDDKLAPDTGAAHSRYVTVSQIKNIIAPGSPLLQQSIAFANAENLKREAQFEQVERWLEKHGLVVTFRGNRCVLRDALRAALAPHWGDATGPVPARAVLLHAAVALLEARQVSEPAEALLRELQSGRLRADSRYWRRDGKTATGTIHPKWWHHVARFDDGAWFDSDIVWFGDEPCDPQTPIRARQITLGRADIDGLWHEPLIHPDLQPFAGGITRVDAEYDERTGDVLHPSSRAERGTDDRVRKSDRERHAKIRRACKELHDQGQTFRTAKEEHAAVLKLCGVAGPLPRGWDYKTFCRLKGSIAH